MVGRQFTDEIERQLDAARCVVVLWSEASVRSRWVPEEADDAAERGILIPIAIEKGVRPPLSFRRAHMADLTEWNGGPSRELDQVLASIEALLGLEKTAVAKAADARPERSRVSQVVLTSAAALLVCGSLAIAFTPGRDSLRRLSTRRVLSRLTAAAGGQALPTARFTLAPAPRTLQQSVQLPEGVSVKPDELARFENDRQASAYAHVLVGKHDVAERAMSQAVAEKQEDPECWSDLAAVRYETAVARGNDTKLLEALASVDRAIPLDQLHGASRFNRALVVERMGLAAEAAAGWRTFLGIESDSEWARVARERLAAIEKTRGDWREGQKRLTDALDRVDSPAVQEVVQAFPQQSREWAEETSLGAWSATRNDPEAAARCLREARAVGEALHRFLRESLLYDAVIAIDTASPDRLAALKAAHAEYLEASIAYGGDALAEAEAGFERAANAFAAAGSAMADVARFEHARTLYDRGQIEKATLLLKALAAHERLHQHRALLAQILYQLALCHTAERRWDAVTETAVEAVRIFSDLGETANAGFAESVVADAYDYLDRPGDAWRHRLAAFRFLSGARDQHRLRAELAAASTAEVERGHIDIALSLLQLEEEVTASLADPRQTAELLLRKSRALGRKGDVAAALATLESARSLARRTGSVALGTDIDAAEGLLQLSANPRKSVVLLTSAIEANERSARRDVLADLYLARGRAAVAVSDSPAAERDFREATRYLQGTDAGRWQPSRRAGLTETREQIFEEWIRLLVRQNRVEEAFRVLERLRALTLRDHLDWPASESAFTRPIDASMVSANLAGRTMLVAFYALPETLLRFSVDQTGLRLSTRDIRREELTARCDAFTKAIIAGETLSAVQNRGADLYELLFGSSELNDVQHLVVIASEPLRALPFAALYDRNGRRYLIENAVLTVAASATSFIVNAQRDRVLANRAPGSALVVGDPAFRAAGEYASLARLPGAAAEARVVAGLYRESVLLRGTEATEERFLAALPRTSVIHFAGHSLADRVRPEYARLLLAPTEKETGVINAGDVARLDLEQVRVVVLAACRTIPGPSSYAGAPGLAEAFLFAGVPQVAGTRWEIDDHTSMRFFTAFHRAITAGVSPASAVRQAQLAFLRGNATAHPRHWAGFEVIGGSVTALAR